MPDKLEIKEQDFITSTGKKLEGKELVVSCPMWLSNVNAKKNCGKCLMKEKLSLKNKYVICKYRERMK
jgi:hypothetical protein